MMKMAGVIQRPSKKHACFLEAAAWNLSRLAPLGPRLTDVERPSIRCQNTAFGESLRANTVRGNRTEKPLRGKSASERVSEREGCRKFSEVFRDFQRLSEIFRDISEVVRDFSEGFRDPFRGRFPSQRLLGPVAPDRVAP